MEEVDDFTKFRRFLCLGSEKGTFQPFDKNPSLKDVESMHRLISNGRGQEVLDEIVRFSEEDLSAKQKPVIYALAVCAKDPCGASTRPLQQAAYNKLSTVCRIPTQMFMFIKFCQSLKQDDEAEFNERQSPGWNKQMRKSLCDWYNNKDALTLAMQVTKYRRRHKWSHRDVLRMIHCNPKDSTGKIHKAKEYVIRYAAKNYKLPSNTHTNVDTYTDEEQRVVEYLKAVDDVKAARTESDQQRAMSLIRQHRLAHEHVPTWLHKSKQMWQALVEDMPVMAMVRNLGRMTGLGVFEDPSYTRHVVSVLQDHGRVSQARLHPYHLLVALSNYKSGKAKGSKNNWQPEPTIIDALKQAFFKSFERVNPTNKRIMVAVHWRGASNSSDDSTMKLPLAASIMSFLRTEPHPVQVVGFPKGSQTVANIHLDPRLSAEDILEEINKVKMGGIDAALPIMFALQERLEVDCFIVFSDCEDAEYHGYRDAAAELLKYQQAMHVHDPRMILVSLATRRGFGLAKGRCMLDVCGFDTSVPALLHNFINGVFDSNDDIMDTKL